MTEQPQSADGRPGGPVAARVGVPSEDPDDTLSSRIYRYIMGSQSTEPRVVEPTGRADR